MCFRRGHFVLFGKYASSFRSNLLTTPNTEAAILPIYWYKHAVQHRKTPVLIFLRLPAQSLVTAINRSFRLLVPVSKKDLNFALEQAFKDPEGKYRYSSTLSLTSVLDGGG